MEQQDSFASWRIWAWAVAVVAFLIAAVVNAMNGNMPLAIISSTIAILVFVVGSV